MKLWMRKTFVVLVTMATFGTVAPPGIASENDESNGDVPKRPHYVKATEKTDVHRFADSQSVVFFPDPLDWQETASSINQRDELIETFVSYATTHATNVSVEKFGDDIQAKVGAPFQQEVVPGLRLVFETFANGMDDQSIKNLLFTSVPAGGTGEKIFHLYHGETGEDLFRFHVRRDHPPKEGYFFNFHYHTHHDDFQAHYEVASIPWGYNTPPAWNV
ncbi:YpjP family protein [Aureibacillus halotolerans]|uniref:YpjP-like protein n=1 Tax=Aureibacillus halotolerans TaxID=1508390 RepID=A0A4R6U4R4_9BACI|nr:YpjP family protein [Aureibacillus halotolerans]TDQ41458.1 YpjP-like protein [Aureibacillus halotolerans]